MASFLVKQILRNQNLTFAINKNNHFQSGNGGVTLKSCIIRSIESRMGFSFSFKELSMKVFL